MDAHHKYLVLLENKKNFIFCPRFLWYVCYSNSKVVYTIWSYSCTVFYGMIGNTQNQTAFKSTKHSIHHLVNLKIWWAKTISVKALELLFIKSIFGTCYTNLKNISFETYTRTNSFALVSRCFFINMNWGNVTVIFHIEFQFLLFPYSTITLCRSFALMSPLICFGNSTYSVYSVYMIHLYMYYIHIHSWILFSFLFGGDVQNM